MDLLNRICLLAVSTEHMLEAFIDGLGSMMEKHVLICRSNTLLLEGSTRKDGESNVSHGMERF